TRFSRDWSSDVCSSDLIYGDRDLESWVERLIQLMAYPAGMARVQAHQNHWDQRDIALISYGDSIHRAGEKPLVTLRRFLAAELRSEERRVGKECASGWA